MVGSGEQHSSAMGKKPFLAFQNAISRKDTTPEKRSENAAKLEQGWYEDTIPRAKNGTVLREEVLNELLKY